MTIPTIMSALNVCASYAADIRKGRSRPHARHCTNKARVAHVLYSLIVTKGDNGKWQPNYSGLGGNLASAAISNTYYPRANRGVGLVFQGFGTVMAEHLAVRMLDEFVFRPAKGSVAN